MTLPARRETFGELGEAMRALPNEKWRDFVRYYLVGKPLRGVAGAYRKAGFQSGNTLNDARNAYQLLHDDRMQRGIAEESRKHYRAAIPGAVEAVGRSSPIPITRTGPGSRKACSIASTRSSPATI